MSNNARIRTFLDQSQDTSSCCFFKAWSTHSSFSFRCLYHRIPSSVFKFLSPLLPWWFIPHFTSNQISREKIIALFKSVEERIRKVCQSQRIDFMNHNQHFWFNFVHLFHYKMTNPCLSVTSKSSSIKSNSSFSIDSILSDSPSSNSPPSIVPPRQVLDGGIADERRAQTQANFWAQLFHHHQLTHQPTMDQYFQSSKF